MWSRLAIIGAFVCLLMDGSAAIAAGDPPARVGRLSFVEGTVSLRPADRGPDSPDGAEPDWRAPTVNYPVTTGNSFWTEQGGKAEVQVGPAEVRLDQQTELEVLRLDDGAVDLALHQGSLNVHVGSDLAGGLRIDTPRGPVRLNRPGSYRVAVETSGDNADDSVELAVFDGEAELQAVSGDRTDTHRVGRGQSAKVARDVVLADARVTPFDQWAKSRDPGVALAQPAQNPGGTVQPRPVQQTTQYVSPQATGYQDLAAYGTWEQTPNYGAVWYPTIVVDDWAPYRYGHWDYIRPWGWTWIDDAPWGFTPFHYGRWVRVGPRWAWWPGHRTVRPVYAPALVAFVGGGGWSVSIASGRARPVGWVPLAPYEVYRPHYRTSATYVRNVNVTTVNKTVEINKMVNRNAATVVSADNFRRGRKVNEAKIDVPRKEFDKARVTSDVRRIAPERGAARAESPRPPKPDNVRNGDTIRRPDPGIVSREPQREQRREPAQDRQPRSTQQDQQRRQQVQQQEHQQRNQADQEQQQRLQHQAQDQQRREAQDRQRRDQAEQNQRRERDAQEQRRRQQRDQDQRSEQQQIQQQRQAQERQRRDQAQEQRQRRDQEQEQRQRRDQAEQDQQRRQREIQDRQQREQRSQAREQQRRQQAEQQQPQQQEQVRDEQRRRGPDRREERRERPG